jgi:hypothetical protein
MVEKKELALLCIYIQYIWMNNSSKWHHSVCGDDAETILGMYMFSSRGAQENSAHVRVRNESSLFDIIKKTQFPCAAALHIHYHK